MYSVRKIKKDTLKLIYKLGSMPPNERQKCIDELAKNLQRIDNEINGLLDQQDEIIERAKPRELTVEQLRDIMFGCAVATFCLGGCLGAATGNNQVLLGSLYSILLTLPTTYLTAMNIQRKVISNKILAIKYTLIQGKILKLAMEKTAKEFEMSYALAYVDAYETLTKLTNTPNVFLDKEHNKNK